MIAHKMYSLGSLALCLAMVGCKNLTSVENQSVVLPPNLQNPAGAENLRVGALSTLFGAFSGQSLFTGLFVDEFTVSSSSFSPNLPDDQRNLSTIQAGNYPFQAMSSGRIDAIIAISYLKQYAPTPAWHIGELYALTANTELEFAENLCSGVPLAVVNGLTPSYGPTLSRQQMVRQVLTDLDSASKYTTGSDSIASLVAVLRGRALADSGDLTAAGAAVQQVPLAFSYTAELSDTTAVNQIYNEVVFNQQVTVSDREGTNGLPFVSADDPRVPITVIQGNGVNINADGNVLAGGAPLTMASGIEAQLLQAEAALSSGQVATWSNILNGLRQNAITPAMQPLTADSTTTASPSMQLAVMFRERAFWLFETGHRLGDLRRLVRQYGLPANSVFPIGAYLGGPSTYGSDVVYPVGGEQYDPNYHGCSNDAA